MFKNLYEKMFYQGLRIRLIEEKIIEFDSYKIIDESKGIMMIESEEGYGLYSSESGIILNSWPTNFYLITKN